MGNLLYVKTGFLAQSVGKIQNIGFSTSISKLTGFHYLFVLFYCLVIHRNIVEVKHIIIIIIIIIIY
jgi:hypothetical protein